MMNFTPFGVPISAALPIATQFQSGKLTQNVTTANGQVVGVLQGGENGVHYIRPLDVNAFAQSSGQGNGQQAQTVITLPITMPGAKPGDPQQTVQIQVINQNAMSPPSPGQSPKYHMTPIPLQGFGQGATVLTVAYNPNQEGMQIIEGHNGMPIGEGMTVVAAIQPQDIQLIQTDDKKEMMPVSLIKSEMTKDDSQQEMATSIAIPANYVQATTTVQEYFQKMHHQSTLNLHPFLKFNTPGIKQENFGDDAGIEGMTITTESESGQQMVVNSIEYVENEESVDDPDKNKRRKKYKKKPPKPKKPKPGQVHIATALDGTTLFCCPECHMAYPEKELLEQHLVGHKIERRFICDICGAGLKRKEHLERHKLGHNPERPFVCSICMKGFKRKEHLNLHFVIHSGEKTEICDECGKGFYRKDHLRKHQRSHVTRRAKELAERQQSSLITTKDGTAQVTIQIDGQDGNPEGVTVVTTLQPQDVQLMQGDDKNNDKDPLLNSDSSKDEDRDQVVESGVFDTNIMYSQNKVMQDYLIKLQQQNGSLPVSLQQFLKVNNIGIQQQEDLSGEHVMMPSSQLQIPVQIQVPQHHIQMANQTEDDSSQVSTVVLPSPSEGLAQHHIQMDSTTQDENGQVSTVVLPSSSEGLSIN